MVGKTWVIKSLQTGSEFFLILQQPTHSYKVYKECVYKEYDLYHPKTAHLSVNVLFHSVIITLLSNDFFCIHVKRGVLI